MLARVSWICLLVACDSTASVADAGRDAAATDSAVAPDAALVDTGPLPTGWRTETPLPFAVQELAYTMHDGSIVIAGGIDGRLATRTDVLALDPGASSWRALPSLPGPRHHVGLASLGGDLYALGGMDSLAFDPLGECFVLRAGAMAWTPIAPMPETRAAALVATVGGRIVVIGGQTRGGLASAVLVYDPAADAWSSAASLPRPREHLAGFVDGAEVWLVGGRNFTLDTAGALVDVYDPTGDVFRESAPLVGPHAGHGSVMSGTTALVVGGELPDSVVDTVETRASDGTWSVLTHVPTPRHGLAIGVLDGRLYVIGGATAPTFGASDVVESFALP